MGTNTLVTKADGEIIASSDPNQYKTALTVDVVPRNSAGVPTDRGGDLGTSSFKWKRLNISAGYLNAGMIMPMHTYSNTVEISQGWFPCNGDIINETNYNSVHGAGAWADFIQSSPLNGKHSPNLNQKYLTGSASTAQDGSSALTYVGVSGNSLNLAHTHNMLHNHAWANSLSPAFPSGRAFSTYSSGGAFAYINTSSRQNTSGATRTYISTQPVANNASAQAPDDVWYTDQSQTNTGSALSSPQSIRPHSLEVIYYIRII